MITSQSIAALTAALVHSSVMDCPQARLRHQTFLLRMLGAGAAALAAAPFFLAFRGGPTLAEAIIFGLALAPLGALALVLKTGRLAHGQLVSAGALVAIGVALAATGQASLGCAAAWIAAAQTEGAFASGRGMVAGLAAASLLAFGGLVALDFVVHLPATTPRGDLLAAAALAHAVANILCGRHLRGSLDRTGHLQVERAKTIAATVGDLVVSYDATGAVDHVGPACERLLGLSPVDLVGRGLFEHVHVADRPAFLKAVADAAHGSEVVTATFRLRVPRDNHGENRTETTFLWMEMRAQRLRSGVVSLLHDVTSHKQNEADLEAARQAAEEASRSKDNFLANMSHELRTPLNAIIGFSEMLATSGLRPREGAKQDEYARIINQSGQHLLAVVNSILDMSKIQSGTFAINPEPFLIAPLIDSCCEMITLKAQEGGIEILRAGGTPNETLVGDRRACKQILINLLSNAVKFTPRNGKVTISMRPDGNSLAICVSDTGIGIGAEDLARLGNPFFQARSSLDRPYEGTGLGLSVVRGLVGLHGGTIAVESEPGRGTGVTVRLPLDCRFVAAAGGSAIIETMARRRSPDRIGLPSHDFRVKKIA